MQDGCALRHAFFQSFREDFDVVKEAVGPVWPSGWDAGANARHRDGLVQAIANDWRAYKYASGELKRNKDLGRP